ncbi:MAG: hypothetical protein K1X89_21085 [Myxococcaceae bacterium]|nr:hypothetical protein [Myxococcaceae bacterium]
MTGVRAVLMAAVVVVAACGETTPVEPTVAEQGGPAGQTGAELGRAKECVLGTFDVHLGMSEDLRDAVGTSFIKDPGQGYFKHVAIAGVMDAVLTPSSVGSPNEYFYSIATWDVVPDERPGKSGMVLQLSAGPADEAVLVTAKKRYQAAKALFDAMTRAKETVEKHVATGAYDMSWNRTTRTSAHGRVSCSAITHPGQRDQRPVYDCTIDGFERTMLQIFSTADGTCPVQ